MASFSSIGVGLGGSVDVNGLIKAQVDAVKLAITRPNGLNYQGKVTEAKISTFGKLQSLVSTLQGAVGKLSSITGWNAVSASSSNDKLITASAIGGTVETTFSVTVSQLAKAQVSTSDALSAAGVVGEGTLKIETGKWSAGSFAVGTSPSIDVAVTSTDTLADIAGKINGANAGVTASILSDASGERLLLRSKTTGEEAGFQMTVTDGDGNNADATGLSRLTTGSSIDYGVNAQATVNGIPVSSATNQFNTVSGVTFNAVKVTTSPVEVTVAKDTTAVKANIDAFVKAYNTLNNALNDITKYDKENKTAGLLQGDSTALGLQNSLRTAIQSMADGAGGLRGLSSIGIGVAGGLSNLNPTGELVVDSAKLNKALENPDAVKAMFRGPDGGTATDGVSEKILNVTKSLLASDGFFASKDKLLQASLKRNATEIQRVNDLADSTETNLKARYTALDTKMSSLNALNAYITQQITTWNKSS